MAREQTEALPTRGLRPANVAGGQYRVAVQQAPESGYTKLAKALSSVSTGLSAYTQAGETLSEMYEQEIGEMNLEQVKAEQAKMQKRLDGAVRKGKLPFLGNPMNWERNQKAIARRYASLLHSQTTSSEGRFQNGKRPDDWKLSVGQILTEERDEFLSKNSELNQNPLMLQAFEGEWQQRSNMMHQRFSDVKRKEMLIETTRETAHSILDSFTTGIDSIENDDTLTGIQKDQEIIRVKEQILEKWGDLNALTPTDQLNVIRKITKMMADTDPKEATDFLEFAKENLQVGDRLFGKETATIRDIEKIIQDSEEDTSNQQLEDLTEAHRIGELLGTQDLNTYAILEARILNGELAEYDGQSFNTKKELKEHFLQFARDVGGSRGAFLLKEINERVDRDPNNIVASQVQELSNRQVNYVRLYSDSFTKVLQGLDIDEKIKFPIGSRESLDLQTEFLSDLNKTLEQTSQDLAGGVNRDSQFGTPEEATAVFNKDIHGKATVLGDTLKVKYDALLDEYQQRATKLQEQFKKAEQDRQSDSVAATNLEAIDLRKYKGFEGGKQLADAMLSNIRVSAFGDKDQRKQASEYLKNSLSLDEVQQIVSGEKQFKADPVVKYGFGPPIHYFGIRYTEEDREAFEDVYIKMQSLSGVLTSLDQMKQDPDNPHIYIHTKETIDPNQGRFSYTTYPIDTREINSRYHRILSRDEVNANNPKDPRVIEKAKRIGKDGITPRELLDNQREWYEQYSEFIERLGIE